MGFQIWKNRWKAGGGRREKCIRSTTVEKTKKMDRFRKQRNWITTPQLKLDYLCGRVRIQFKNEILTFRGSFSCQWINVYLSFKSERHCSWVCKRLAQTYDTTIVEDMNLFGSSDKGCTEDFILNCAQCLYRNN